MCNQQIWRVNLPNILRSRQNIQAPKISLKIDNNSINLIHCSFVLRVQTACIWMNASSIAGNSFVIFAQL